MGNVFDEIIETKEKFQRTIRNEGERMLKQHFAAWFEANPDVLAVRFTAYTPYFADGDPCTYGVGEFYYKFTDTADDAGDYEDGFEYLSSYRKNDDKINGRVDEIPEEVIEGVFGDHVKVTATREGFDVEEYMHD